MAYRKRKLLLNHLMNNVCKECQLFFETERSLHAHLKTHDLKVWEYYHKHYPRKDILTGEPIIFNNTEQYFQSDFKNRDNMALWFQKNKGSEAVKFGYLLLEKRIKQKNLKYAPYHLDLQTIMVPNVRFFQKNTQEGYEAICNRLGAICRVSYSKPMRFKPVDERFYILRDTREQNPVMFGCKVEVTKLDFGDYTAGGDFHNNVFIERKSLSDLLGTLSGGYDRFCNEVKRAKELGSYLVVMCEEPFKSFKHFKERRDIHSQASFSFISHRMRELTENNNNIQFLFINGRSEMAKIMSLIFRMENSIDNVDLQYQYDIGGMK